MRYPVSFSKLWKKAHDSPTEFSAWTALLDLVEKQQNIEHARKAFDDFFQHFPYCYGYWKKWAEMEKHKGDKLRSLEVYKAGVKAVPLSVDLWTAYLEAAIDYYHGRDEYEETMRSLYEEAIATAGLEFRSDALWEHYISWETGHNRLRNAVDVYTRLLQTPTQLYFQNWDSFNKLVEDNRPEDLLSRNEFARFHAQVSLKAAKVQPFKQPDVDAGDDLEPPIVGVTKPVVEITDTARSAIRELLIASREQLYQATYTQIMKRWYFEEKIRRPYFHVKPLEEVQLTNWAEYLSFEEAEAAAVCANLREELKSQHPEMSDEELDNAVASSDTGKLAKRRVLVLYERCLVPCALYEHFWIRYARYLEITERNIPGAREVWRRACTLHLRHKPTIHWHWGCFEDRYPSDLDTPPTYPVRTCLDILTELEARMTDSALVCCRRADAMRRAKKPLFDIIACLRSGINRLRFLAEEQTKLAKSLSGPTASRTVAQALATAAQARAGAGVLAGRIARLLHRDESVIPTDGVPLWMLLLHTVHDEGEDDKQEDIFPVPEVEEEQIKPEEAENEEAKQPGSDESMDSSMKADKEGSASGNSEDEAMDEGQDDEDECGESSSAESMDDDGEVEPVGEDRKASPDTEQPEEDGSASPPVLPVTRPDATNGKRKADATTDSEGRQSKKNKRAKKSVKSEEEKEEEDEAAAARAAEEERIKKEKELAAAEEERIRSLLDKRHRLIHLHAPPLETLTEEEKSVLKPEEAAIRILKEAIEYDPRNERLYAHLLDIIYQRRPPDIEAFVEVTNSATIDSMLPAAVKLAFCQRKLQFLEEFDTDVSRLCLAYEEYLGLCEAVNSGVAAAAAARGTTRFTSGYPLPDLLNLPSASARMTAVAGAGSGDALVSAGPVARLPCLNTDQAALEAAASVGTPTPDPSTSAGYFTGGAYEPLAAALGNVTGLPPQAPTNIPLMNPALTMQDAAWAAAAAADPYASYYYGAVGAAAMPVSMDYAAPTTSASLSTSTVS
ncbi:hypothetical protein X801_03661 [Opisthorchis viverrini]|uniref:Uncharacterized protein n=1 Tax=Opisthorchis viverrini TaxID=6198 RepID=A0A1S8X1A1_OPIVI|nr:hypothetical protein X801_03661 [Opisthorchis viverrini]